MTRPPDPPTDADVTVAVRALLHDDGARVLAWRVEAVDWRVVS